MRRLFWVLVLLVSVVWHVAPVSAAQRVLLMAEGQNPAGAAGEKALGASGTVGSLRAAALKSGTVRVIVGLRVPFAPAMSLSAAEARQQDGEIATATTAVSQRFAAAISRAPDRARTYASVPFIAMEVTPAELDRLGADPDVISITPDLVLTTKLMESATLVRAPEAWAAGYTGLGQTIAVIDTGVDRFHPFLSGKVMSEACYTDGACPGGGSSSTASGSGRPCSASDCDHGTHVAGIAAGRLPGGLSGIAPDAKIIAIQVFTPVSAVESLANLSDVLKGLERVYALRDSYNISAANMSLGTVATYSSKCDRTFPAMAAMIEQLEAAGIATVVSSGNEGVSNGISLPACFSKAVSVGSVSDRNWGTCYSAAGTPASTATDKVACYSNASSMLSLLAPGSYITSSIPYGSYEGKHGTSMAAPHVAGAFALLRERATGASVKTLLDALRSTGKKVTDYRNSRITTPRIDVKAALDSFGIDDGKLPINLTLAGNGRGTVTFTPAGSAASCTDSCASRFAPGTVVTLAATANNKSYFAGWSGACTGMAGCSVAMSSAQNVTAMFTAIASGQPQPLLVTTTGSGGGSVSISADGVAMSCTGNCTANYAQGTQVTLTAAPVPGTVMSGWSGACRGRKASCTVRMTTAKSVNATFTALPMFDVNYTKAGAGGGSIDVITHQGTMNCGDNCSSQYPAGTTIKLTARPTPGAVFGGWSGLCKGRKASCSLRLRAAGSVLATFN
jgi:subtilisin family serine protease